VVTFTLLYCVKQTMG